MDPLSLGYFALIVLCGWAVMRWASARLPVAAISLGLAGYFAWHVWTLHQALQQAPATPREGVYSVVSLVLNISGLVVHVLVAAALITEVAIGRRRRPPASV